MSKFIFSHIQRILTKITIPKSRCWEWIGGCDIGGYGVISISFKNYKIHRVVYEYYYGAFCPDLTIDHLCRNRKCCNPNHLEAVTHKENTLRGVGITAINARKTHCIRGHEFTPKNTYNDKKGHRYCKSCLIIRQQARQKRLKCEL